MSKDGNFDVDVDDDAQKNKIADETESESEKETRLFWESYDQFLKLEDDLKEAHGNPHTVDEIFNSLPTIARDMSSGDKPFSRFVAAAKISFIMEYEDPPINEIIQHGLIPHLVRFLGLQQAPPLQIVAFKALCGILEGSPKQAQAVLEHDGVAELFVRALSSEDQNVLSEAAYAVVVAARISVQVSRTLFKHGAFTRLVALLEQYSEPGMLRNSFTRLKSSSTALKKLCSGGSQPAIDQFKMALPTLRKLLTLLPNNVDVLGLVCEDVCWTLSYVSRSVNQIQAIVDADLCPTLVMLLELPGDGRIHATLRIIENFLKSIDTHVQLMIGSGVFPRLHQILEQHQVLPRRILKTTCSIISGLKYGVRPPIQMILDADLIPPLLDILHDLLAPKDVRQEAIRTLADVVRRGSFQHINFLVDQGCIEHLCLYLQCEDTRVRWLCVAGLWNILSKGSENEVDGVNPFVAMVRASGGFSWLLNLQHDAHVGDLARSILINFIN